MASTCTPINLINPSSSIAHPVHSSSVSLGNGVYVSGQETGTGLALETPAGQDTGKILRHSRAEVMTDIVYVAANTRADVVSLDISVRTTNNIFMVVGIPCFVEFPSPGSRSAPPAPTIRQPGGASPRESWTP